MKNGRLLPKAILLLAVVLVSLTTVAWRQSTTRETMEELAAAERELAIAVDEREELSRELSAMETRPWIGAEAARRLGMRAPTENEVVIAPGGER